MSARVRRRWSMAAWLLILASAAFEGRRLYNGGAMLLRLRAKRQLRCNAVRHGRTAKDET